MVDRVTTIMRRRMSSSGDRTKLAQQYEWLVDAAYAGDLQRVTELLDGAKSPHELVNARFSYGSPGMTPTQARGRMQTPLLMAAARSNNVAVLQRLLQCGANVDERIEDGRTALQFAAGEDNVNVLLDHGADLCQALLSPSHFKMDSRRPRLLKIRIKLLVNQWRRAVRVQIISMLWRRHLLALYTHVHFKPGSPGQHASFEEFRAAAKQLTELKLC